VNFNFGGIGRYLHARVIFLALVVAALSATFLSGSAGTAVAATPAPIVGAWNVTYGAPATVAMTLVNGVYTETAGTPVQVTGSSCDLPPGTVIATFSKTGPGTYAGQHGLWFTSNCSFDMSVDMTVTLSSDGNTLTAVLDGGYGTIVFTKVYRVTGADPIIGPWNVTYGAPATVTMTLSNGVYTERAKTPVRVVGSSCDLPAGTVISTFSQTGPDAYAGVHGLWFTSNCSFDTWTGTTFTLSGNGNKLTADIDHGYETIVFTKVPAIKEVVPPAITGTVKVGSKVMAKPGSWNPQSGVKFTYQWLSNDIRISGATSQSYRIPSALAGRKLSVTVTASKPGYQDGKASSAARVVARGTFVITVKPKLTGTPEVGKTLTVTKGTWIPVPAIKVQWYANGHAIAHATSLSLKLTSAMKGATVSVKVTAERSGYTTATVTLRETKKVQ
jgi:hypothetical protein